MSSAAPHALPEVNSFVEVLPVPPLQERRRGIVRFAGLTDFADGEWVGVELVGSEGRNDGSVKGQSYFRCLPGQGVFVRPNLIVPFSGASSSIAEEKASAPDPALITALEEQLASAQRRAAEEADAATALRAELLKTQTDAVTAAARRAAEEDDELTAQVRQEEERLTLQRQLQACEAQLHEAQASAKTAADRQKAAEARAAKLQESLASAQTALVKAKAQAEASAAAAAARAAPSPAAAEADGLRCELKSRLAELQQLRLEKDTITQKVQELTAAQQTQQERLSAAEERARVTEQRLQKLQHQQSEEASQASSAEATALAQLRAELEAHKTQAAANLDAATTAAVRGVEERLAEEKAAALREHDAASREAMADMEREKAELQELCQLLEDELKEEKTQSDELARLVEQLGAEKAAAESAVGTAQEQTVQERDRLRRDLEEARAREVHLKAAVEAAQQERDTALKDQQHEQHTRDSTAPPSRAASNPRPAEMSPDISSNADAAAALATCQNALDEARMRLLQLSSTEQVALALQVRCDELDRTVQAQRLEAQGKLSALQSSAAAAQAKAAEEVLLWKRQCVAAQRQVGELSTAMAQLQQQQHHGAHDNAQASSIAAAAPLDAARERAYELRIAALTRQLLEYQAVRVSAVAALANTAVTATIDNVGTGTSRPLVRILDFTTPEACKASTQSMFL